MGKTRDLFKKIRDTKGTFHAKMGSMKDRNGMDLTEAEDIKKRQQEYTEELLKRLLNNHSGVITHLEPGILESEVRWALGSITTNKARGGDGIPVELFQILKDDAVKVLHSRCQQLGKTQLWPQTGKGQFSFQSQRKAIPKNIQTTAQLHSSHMLPSCLENPRDGRAWWAAVYGVAESDTTEVTQQQQQQHMLVKSCSKFSKPGFSNT